MTNNISYLIDSVISEIENSTVDNIVELTLDYLSNKKDSYIALSDADEDVTDRVCELDENIHTNEKLRKEVIKEFKRRLDI